MAASQTLLVSFLFASVLVELSMAANYIVGGPNGGWDTSTDQNTWASSHTFVVGDNLIFQYSPGHDVAEVTKADYNSCQASSPLQTYTSGSTAIPLTSPGKRYFICSSPGHCAAGMKLEINTLAASPTLSLPPVVSPAVSVSTPSPAPLVDPVLPPASEASSPLVTPFSPLVSVSTPSPALLVDPDLPSAPEASSPLATPSSKSVPRLSPNPSIMPTPPSHVSAESETSSAKKGHLRINLTVALSFFSVLLVAANAS